MGVSPVTLDDLSSGYNIDWNISTDSRFNAMMGFSETEVREMFRYYQENDALPGDIEAMIAEMKPWYDNYCFARMSLGDDRVFNCDMTLYYLRSQFDFHRSPEEMVDKNIRTDYSKLKMLARIDHDSAHEGSRMSTIEEIAAKGEILVNLHTSFPAERVADVDNFRSLLYYYGLLTMCGTRGDRLRMCIPNHCVREQYFGFLREYYQQAHPLDLSRLKDQIDDLAYDGVWKPFFESIACAYRENSSVRDGMEGERNLQGFLKAYLALASYYLVEPELEMNYGYCDFFLLPDKQRYPDIELVFDVIAENTPPSLCTRYDLVFTPCEYAQLPTGVVRRLIYSHGAYAVLPPGHALMTKSLIALHQLAGETLIVPYAWEPFGPYARNRLLA